MTPIEHLLSLLSNIRRSGPGWRADCPNRHSSRGTLSVAEADTGGVLLHCFVGCSAAEIVAPIGLGMSALFPDREHPQSEAERRANRERLALAGIRSAAAVLDREAGIVADLAETIRAGRSIDDVEMARLSDAVARVDAARLALAREVRQ